MPFEYALPPARMERLRQGQLLQGVVEFRIDVAHMVEAPSGVLIEHPLVVVLTADCDLEQDFNRRQTNSTDVGNRNILPGVLLCDLHEEHQIRPSINVTEIWKRATKNQDERYHALLEASCAGTSTALPMYVIDFKRSVTVPPGAIYASIEAEKVRSPGCITGEYLYDLMHRFFAFQSRVGVD